MFCLLAWGTTNLSGADQVVCVCVSVLFPLPFGMSWPFLGGETFPSIRGLFFWDGDPTVVVRLARLQTKVFHLLELFFVFKRIPGWF